VPETQTNEIAAAREALRLAAADDTFKSRRPTSKTEKIRVLRPEIVKLRSQGRTWQDIADALEGTLAASADTIRLAIGSKKKTGAAGRGGTAQPAAAAASTGARSRATRGVTEPEPKSASTATGPKKRFGPPEL